MSFFSIEFFAVFILFFCIYWAFKNHYKMQNYLILLFNYALILTFSPHFLLVILFYTAFIYYSAFFIHYKKTKFALFASVFFAICYLCFFKYYDQIYAEFSAVLAFFGFESINLQIAFPIGISFYTFASITYLTAIYKKEQKIVSFLTLACYLSFFATLVAGPICKSKFLMPQFERKREFKNADLIFTLLIFAAVKKLIIASYLGDFVTGVFDDPHSFSFMQILLAINLYGVWLYADFSGYVDIVTALALCIGFELPKNFDMPYISKNVKEFWQRWHISLSNFIKDYVYIPLGGNRHGEFRRSLNLLIAFGLSGIWHGVGLNFLIWGLLHGVAVVFLNLTSSWRIKTPFLAVFLNYLYVSFAWVFFANDKFSDVLNIFKALGEVRLYSSYSEFVIAVMLCFLLFFYTKFTNGKERLNLALQKMPFALKPIVLSALFIAIFTFMPSGIPNFIYASF